MCINLLKRCMEILTHSYSCECSKHFNIFSFVNYQIIVSIFKNPAVLVLHFCEMDIYLEPEYRTSMFHVSAYSSHKYTRIIVNNHSSMKIKFCSCTYYGSTLKFGINATGELVDSKLAINKEIATNKTFPLD